MNLITCEGLAMIDPDNVIQMRRVHYACPVERTDRPEPLTLGERIALALIYAASVFIVFAMIGWGFEVLTGIEWATVAQLLGVKR